MGGFIDSLKSYLGTWLDYFTKLVASYWQAFQDFLYSIWAWILQGFTDAASSALEKIDVDPNIFIEKVKAVISLCSTIEYVLPVGECAQIWLVGLVATAAIRAVRWILACIPAVNLG